MHGKHAVPTRHCFLTCRPVLARGPSCSHGHGADLCSPGPTACSVQGYGPKMAGLDAYVYPGSGATCDTRAAPTKPPAAAAAAPAAGTAGAAAAAAEGAPAAPAAPPAGPTTVSAEESAAAAAPAVAASGLEEAASGGTSAAAAQPMDVDGGEAEAAPAASAAPLATAPATDAPAAGAAGAAGGAENGKVEEDPDHEFEYHGGFAVPSGGCAVPICVLQYQSGLWSTRVLFGQHGGFQLYGRVGAPPPGAHSSRFPWGIFQVTG